MTRPIAHEEATPNILKILLKQDEQWLIQYQGYYMH